MSERPGDGPLDVDAAWAEIVAHWGVDGDDVRVVRDGEPPQHPAAEPVDAAGDTEPADDDEPAGDGTAQDAPSDERPVDAEPPAPAGATDVGPVDVPVVERRRVRPEPVPLPPAVPARAADDPLTAALDEHFVPPDPPLGRTDPLTSLAWLGALGGPLFLLVAALAWRSAPSLLIGVAVLAFVAGFVTLVVRMPDRDEDDDGAEV